MLHAGMLSAPFRCLLVRFINYISIFPVGSTGTCEICRMDRAFDCELADYVQELSAWLRSWNDILLDFTFVIGIFIVSILFWFIPHYEHDATPIQSRFHTTSMLKTYPILQPLLTLLLQYQDYHLIHHLYPTIPFYRYADKWQEKQQFLLDRT